MSYNDNDHGGESGSGGNVWSSGSRGGYSRSNDDGQRGGGSYDGSFGNNNSRRGGGSYGFRRNDNGNVQILHDAIFIQDLPKTVTNDELFDIFSNVGKIKIDDRSGGPKIWIYKDRDTGEPNGRAQVTFESDETADRAVAQFNDQHVDSIDATIRVQIAQRRNRNNDDHGGRGGYRGGRNNWDSNKPRQGFSSRGRGGWGDSNGGFSGGRGGGFRSQRNDGGDSYRDNDDRGSFGGGRGGGSYRGNRDAPYRGASHMNSGSSNYTPY